MGQVTVFHGQFAAHFQDIHLVVDGANVHQTYSTWVCLYRMEHIGVRVNRGEGILVGGDRKISARCWTCGSIARE